MCVICAQSQNGRGIAKHQMKMCGKMGGTFCSVYNIVLLQNQRQKNLCGALRFCGPCTQQTFAVIWSQITE